MAITNAIIPVAGGVGLALAFKVFKGILAKPDGDEKVQEIAAQIREGASTFLRQESYYLGIYFSRLALAPRLLSSLVRGALSPQASSECAPPHNPTPALRPQLHGLTPVKL
jgi:Na+/H+-translocating membrane pyrophosphatase